MSSAAAATGDNPSSATTTTTTTTTSAQSTVDAKIMADLDVLAEKMDLCDSVLRPGGGDPSPSVRQDDTIMTVIGFLEACSPRMVELVEAAAQGALSEQVLMKCLEVNDRLTKQLSDIDTTAMIETAASTTAAAAPPTESLDDLLLDDDDSSDIMLKEPAAVGGGGGKSTGEEEEGDPFGNTVLQPTVMPSSPQEPVSTKSEDDFDSFFNERTAADGKPKADDDL